MWGFETTDHKLLMLCPDTVNSKLGSIRSLFKITFQSLLFHSAHLNRNLPKWILFLGIVWFNMTHLCTRGHYVACKRKSPWSAGPSYLVRGHCASTLRTKFLCLTIFLLCGKSARGKEASFPFSLRCTMVSGDIFPEFCDSVSSCHEKKKKVHATNSCRSWLKKNYAWSFFPDHGPKWSLNNLKWNDAHATDKYDSVRFHTQSTPGPKHQITDR